MADPTVNFNDQPQDHAADRMMGKIQRSMRLIRRVMNERRKFAEVLQIRYNDQTGSVTQAKAMDGEDFRRHGENYSWVLMRYIMAQVAGEDLFIRSDRNQGAEKEGIPGDATTGTWVDELMKRAATDGELLHEMAELGKMVCAYGCGAMVVGYRDGAERQEALREAAKDHNEVIQETLRKGDLVAKRGQDHERIQFHLREAARGEQITSDQAEALTKRAQSHDAMALKEEAAAQLKKKDDAPAWAFDWRLADNNVWANARHVGEDVVFDMTVNDKRHHAFRAEKVMVPLKQFKKDLSYSRAARMHETLQGVGKRDKSMLADDAQPYSQHAEQLKDLHAEPMVETWRVWIRKPDMRTGGVRRIVSPELPGMWIHADETYPYLNKELIPQEDGTELEGPDHGKPLIKGWWPIDICAPLTGPIPVPETQLGIPLISPSWAQQIEINQYAAISHGKAKRGLRIFVGDRTAFSDDKERKAIEMTAASGIDGAFHWVTPAAGKTIDKALATLDFRDSAPEIQATKNDQISTFARIARMPEAALGLVGTSGTLGQDEAAKTQGDVEQDMVLKPLEATAAYVIRAWAGLMREHYSDEKIRRLLGARGAKAFMAYKHSALDGDKFEIMLGSRAKKREVVDRKQTAEAIQLANEVFVDDIGAPIYDMKPQFETLLRSLGLGGLEPLKNFQEDPRYGKVLQMLDALAIAMQEMRKALGIEDDNKAGSAGATPGPDATTSLDGQAPQTGTLNAGARRDTVGV